MSEKERRIESLLGDLGHRPLNRTWAKLEILLGLTAAGGGMLMATWALGQTGVQFDFALAGLVLFVLGGYLALAGSRSHLYQSNNELTAYLVEEIRSLKAGKEKHA
jgi:hypothetical protein